MGMQRTVKRISRSGEPAADLAFWLARPMAERIAAVEVLRRLHDLQEEDGDAEPQLQKVCRVVQRKLTTGLDLADLERVEPPLADSQDLACGL